MPQGLNDRTSAIEFMQIDCDYYTQNNNDRAKEVPVIRMFGVTEGGNSVCAHVHQFTAYFYVHIVEPNVQIEPAAIEQFI